MSCHVYSFKGNSWTLLCTLVLVDPYGRYYVLPFMSRNHILYIIPHDQLLLFDHSFFHKWKGLHQWCHPTVSHNYSVFEASYFGLEVSSYFSSSWNISRVQDGLHLSRWIYRSLIFFWSSFFHHGVSDPGSFRFMFIGVNLELSSLVLWNKSHPPFLVGGCTRPFLQVKCTSCMVRNIS